MPPSGRWTAFLALTFLLSSGCGDDGGGNGSADAVYPGVSWETVAPADAGVDAAILDELATYVESENSNCLVVVRGGRIVGEWYWGGFLPATQRDIASVTKSMASTLVGIAQDRGLLSIDEPASNYITEWVGTLSEEVTVRNLLSNDSGRLWSLTNDYASQDDSTAAAIAIEQQHPPGTYWEYNNSAVQTLERVLEVAIGRDVEEFAREVLFDPIGMSAEMRRDTAGNVLLAGGTRTSCRDLARFGLLFLRGGQWSGTQVVSRDWVIEATTQPSTPLNSGYGLLWWMNRPGHWVLPTTLQRNEGDGLLIPSGPSDSYAGVGFAGQLVVVAPTQDLVLTRLGDEPNGTLEEQLLGTTLLENISRLMSDAIVDAG